MNSPRNAFITTKLTSSLTLVTLLGVNNVNLTLGLSSLQNIPGSSSGVVTALASGSVVTSLVGVVGRGLGPGDFSGLGGRGSRGRAGGLGSGGDLGGLTVVCRRGRR